MTRVSILPLSAVLCVMSACAAEVPPVPGPESWTFKAELAEPVAYHAREAYRIADEFGLTGDLAAVRADLGRYMASAPGEAVKTLTLRKGTVDGRESYRVEVAADGSVTLTAEDDDGIRRAAYHFEDRESAGDLRPVVRRPWVKNRISRCFFGPIKRPPFNRDELMDDVDYYPRAYLDRLAHEGVNGLWITVEWRDLAETSFTKRAPDAARRLAKLRRTVDRCLEYGIRTWIFAIEPKSVAADDPFRREHGELFSGVRGWDGRDLMCPSSEAALRYVEESVRDVFMQVPRLGGLVMIANGERPTTCLSMYDPVTGACGRPCPKCGRLEPWQIHERTAQAIVRGIRAAGSPAEYVSWFYHPQVPSARAPWVAEAAGHVPEGTVFAYNFESGIAREQLGKVRHGGDYWLSCAGPADGFAKVAAAAREAGVPLGAKIQVGCSHEVATVPFVPVPGLLYRKYRAMREAGVTTVIQCWYFGNCPGVMNKAAGELSFETFADDEDAFLRRLAAPDWRGDAGTVAAVWKRLSDAYAEYPLSNGIQYYGPFHAGVAWPLLADVELKPLGRTWKPEDAPSGDAIGEALDQHTLLEAAELARRMADGAVAANAGLDALESRWRGDADRLRDLSVMRALECQFMSAADILEFYRERAKAITASRGTPRDGDAALAALRRMDALVRAEIGVTRRLLPLAEADSRLGFHSEAEAHQYHPAKLRWRIGELEATLRRIAEIEKTVAAGGAYPESEFERNAPRIVSGEWMTGRGGARFRVLARENGVSVEVVPQADREFFVRVLDPLATANYRCGRVSAGTGGPVRIDIEGPAGWFFLFDEKGAVWPESKTRAPSRLNLGPFHPCDFGRIVP